MNLKQLGLAVFLLHASVFLQAQTLRAYEKAADKSMTEQNYFAAYTYYQEAVAQDTSQKRLYYKLAKAAYYWQAYPEAIVYFKKADTDAIKATYLSYEYERGLAEMALGNYDEAILQFNRYLKKGGITQQARREAKNKRAACELAIELKKKPIEVEIQHLDKTINSPYSDFAPYLKGDSLYYSSLKYRQKGKKSEQYFSRILLSVEGGDGTPLRKNLNQKGLHNAHITFSTDGKYMYFTRCSNVKDGGIRCEIYRRDVTVKRPKDEKLPNWINLEGYTATQPSIGYDELTQSEWLFFVSDRPGGRGNLDIWMSQIKPDGTLAPPKNIGSTLNSKGNEMTPFFHQNTQTLYFSSDYHGGLGGYDIFKTTRKNKSQWTQPTNLGFPLNSSYNDIYLTLTKDGYTGYFSSNREGVMLLTESACCNDIFKFELPRPAIDTVIPTSPDSLLVAQEEPIPDTLEKGVPTPPTFEEELSAMLPIALYFDNDQPDPKTTKTTTSLSYDETYANYIERKSLFKQKYTAPLQELERIEAAAKMDDFFEEKVEKGYEKLSKLVGLLATELEKGRKIKVYIKGYTSQLASGIYNQNLSKRRINSVVNYLNKTEKGALTAYIQNGQLEIIEVSFGEAQSKEQDTEKDRRKSIYSVSASVERRVEIIEVQ